MTAGQLKYFNNLTPGKSVLISQAKSPEVFLAAGKEYIDRGGSLTFNDDYSVLTKPHPIPKDNLIHVFFD